MATEVIHGPEPKFIKAKANMDDGYLCVIVGHYTDTDGMAAAGVESHKFQSNRPAKRQAELLALRSAFANFFVREWIANEGSLDDALWHLSYDSSGYRRPQLPRMDVQAP